MERGVAQCPGRSPLTSHYGIGFQGDVDGLRGTDELPRAPTGSPGSGLTPDRADSATTWSVPQRVQSLGVLVSGHLPRAYRSSRTCRDRARPPESAAEASGAWPWCARLFTAMSTHTTTPIKDEQDDDTQRRPDPAAAVPVAIIATPPFCWAVRRCRRATDDTGCAVSSILPTDRRQVAGGRWQVAGGRVERPGKRVGGQWVFVCRPAPGRLRSWTSRWVRCPSFRVAARSPGQS